MLSLRVTSKRWCEFPRFRFWSPSRQCGWSRVTVALTVGRASNSTHGASNGTTQVLVHHLSISTYAGSTERMAKLQERLSGLCSCSKPGIDEQLLAHHVLQ